MPAFGWMKNPAEVAKVKARMAIKAFYDLSSHRRFTKERGDAWLWLYESGLLGHTVPPWDQGNIGSCVAHGWGRAVQDLICVQVAKNTGEVWPGHEQCREAIYGGSRVQAGGDGGGGDGSVGAWAAEWVSRWGAGIICTKYDDVDLTNGYDVRRCQSWGDKGVPSGLESVAKEHGVTVAEVRSAEEAADAIVAEHPVAICGNVSRTMQRVDGGWCPQTGNDWPHCQELVGAVVVKSGAGTFQGGDGAHPWAGAKPALVYRNSWGDYLGNAHNTLVLASGKELVLPSGCYLSTFEEADPDLHQGDSFACMTIVPWRNGPTPPPPPPPGPSVAFGLARALEAGNYLLVDAKGDLVVGQVINPGTYTIVPVGQTCRPDRRAGHSQGGNR